jgi:CheY-like chemotaxis protein
LGGRSIPVPRHFVFTLEDSSWVIQREPDFVQELLTGKERSYSSLDIAYEITDIELDLLIAQGIVERYDHAYVWLHETHHTEGLISPSMSDRSFGVTKYYYVDLDLPPNEVDQVQEIIERLGLHDRYRAFVRWNRVIIMGQNGEPFTKLSQVEDADFLLAPALHELGIDAAQQALRFDTNHLNLPWNDKHLKRASSQTIRQFAPQIKGNIIVCIDDEEITHVIVRDVLSTWGVEVFSAYNGRDAISLIEDVDPTLILMDLKLPDMHGYEIVAHVRNNPDLSHIPLIIISAIDSETDRFFAYDIAQAEDYVVKPFTGEIIRRKVWRILT